LELAQNLLREKGYNGFSYKHLATPLGIKNAAIHYHFPTKEDLAIEVVARERRRLQKWITQPSISGMTVWERLDWFFSIYEHYSDNGKKVCYLGNLETEFDSIPAGVQEEARKLNQEIIAWLTKLLEEGREQGAFTFAGEPGSKAVALLASIQGALQIARLMSPERFSTTIQQLRLDLGGS
jgi:AcrR family transcriptional regulator